MPPEKQRRLTPAGKRVLDTASELFYREGLHAIGVEGIAQAAGVTKKTLYDCFGSKDDLIAAYLRNRDERWRSWLTGFVDRQGGAPSEKLLSTFDALAQWQQKENARGCAFVNALAELPDTANPGRAVIAEQKTWMLEYLTALASEASLPAPATVARRLFLLQEGALAAHGTGVPGDAMEFAKSTAAALVDTAHRIPDSGEGR
ncbi:TetR/AcrR family transcriptional regulator [Allosalinactinospora lopnorensis]|uniref:TetR/AcrR family transcriptional regulator n=1 Tax=Allosalinactinospora lopnorensis TaxID=1352348 RepID=UPI000623C5E9|nr:TetR/AcrR family transcriptional regulator [Allosalinactinospora lopnorensis]